MAARTTTTVAPMLSCPKPVIPPVLPLHSSNESSSTPSSNTEPSNKRKSEFCSLGYYMETYSKLIAQRSSPQASSAAELTAPAWSTEPFGPLKLSRHPLLKIDPDVDACMRAMKKVSRRLIESAPESWEPPKYLWSWLVYYIRHVGRPAFAA